WQDNVTLAGWSRLMTSDGTPGVENRWRIDDGGASGGSLYSYGSFGSTDRTLGLTTSSNLPKIQIGARIRNNTSNVLTEFSLNYVGEQWRHAGSPTQKLSVAYALGVSGLGDGGFTDVSCLDFHAPHVSGAGTALNGNLSENRVAIGGVVNGFNWLPGQDLWLRWTGTDQLTSDQGLAVDDLSFRAVPEPASCAVLVGGILTLCRARKRRN
ncbi:MAG: hypothetical protein ABL962_14245, partial [Fimbriimonadaceae bacterium]